MRHWLLIALFPIVFGIPLPRCSWTASPLNNYVVNMHGMVAPEELRPGMTGFCLSPDESGTDRLTFVVVGVQKFLGYQTKIIGRITSGRVLTMGGVARGMSGSSVYLDDGRLIGSLAYTRVDPDNTFFITPIGEMLAQGRHAHPGRYSGVIPATPSYAAFCTVWGDGTSCSHATLTVVQDGIAYATGHSFGDAMQSSSRQVAVFGSSVIMTMKGAPPAREAGLLGELLGTLVWDGVDGSVIQLGEKPSYFTVHLALPSSSSRTFFGIRRNLETPGDMMGVIGGSIQEQLDMGRGWDARIIVSFLDGSPNLVFQDEWINALTALKEFLDLLPVQSPEVLGTVMIDLHETADAGEYELKKLQIKKTPNHLHAQATLIGIGSRRRVVITTPIPRSLRPRDGLGWYLGRNLQTKTLELMPALSAVTTLNRFSERRGVYLACVECDTALTYQDIVQVQGKLKLNDLLVSKAKTMPMSIGEQKPEKPAEKN